MGEERLELSRPKPPHFECGASTNSAIRPWFAPHYYTGLLPAVTAIGNRDFWPSDHCCRVMIVKAGNPSWKDLDWFLASKLSGSTWNIRRRFIKSCTTWAQSEGLIEGKNPWLQLKARKSEKTGAKPLTVEETNLVIQAFEQNRFCSKNAPYKHSFYVPFLKFLFLSAARPGEAIALQWKHIDFNLGVIEIGEAMGRDLALSPYTTKKIRKDTKTGEIRHLPLTQALKEIMLFQRADSAKPTDLVFPGAKGGIMDIRTFRLAWKKVLIGLELDYRPPYQTRHTSLSQIAQHHGLLAAAKVAGHKSLDMVSRHYAKFTGELDEVMPIFDVVTPKES
jgi:integrase